MIDQVICGSAYLNVSSYSGSTYVNGYSGAQGVGNMRYNTSLQKTEVFDGTNWITINPGNATVGLTNEAVAIISWAKEKMLEEQRLEQLAKDNPTIKDLLDKMKDTKEQIKMVETLLNSPGHDTIKPSMIP